MFKKIITAKNFWLNVAVLTVIFILLFNLVRIAVEYKFHFSDYFNFYINSYRFPSFLVFNLIGGFFYALITAYYRYWKHFRSSGRS